ncbi:aminotransferase class V-fold PLP-dependent enzyme [Thalassorhabdus alkalitolerans]|uniref:cysteine desulfurase n=1 Tax=Thalassorhabdus alkalitolerans TaxID=2282697 RepID=A0ABW0YLN6_9BACI
MIYLDHAASSYPKPEMVAKEMASAVMDYGANPGRSGHELSRKAAEKISDTRKLLARMFEAPSAEYVIFTQGATMSLNMAIKGLSWGHGDHVISTAFEHNAVRRPLEFLKREYGVKITYIEADLNGKMSVSALEDSITENTKAIVTTHGSNVTGTIVDLSNIDTLVKEKNLTWIVDASQTAGVIPLSMKKLSIDLAAIPAHKGLLGPQGVGALLLSKKVQIDPLIHGGTGSFSSEEDMPDKLPFTYEGGTLNTPGIAGWHEGLKEVERLGEKAIYEHEKSLAEFVLQELKKMPEYKAFGPGQGRERLGVLSFLLDGVDSQEIAAVLDSHYNIAVRGGVHCSPLLHQQLETADCGLIRVSFGPYNTKKEAEELLAALEEIRDGFLL